MFIAGVLINEDKIDKLKKLGVKDSKLLTHKKRVALSKKIKRISKKYEVLQIEPKEIDKAVDGYDGLNLNWLEARKIALLINKLKPDIAIIDCPSPNIKAFTNYLKKHIKNKKVELIVEHKSDIHHLPCAAASILAKCDREGEIKKLEKRYGNIGSLPYKENVWVENNTHIGIMHIGDIVKNEGMGINIFSLNRADLNVDTHKITFGFKHKQMDIYKVHFNHGITFNLSANHPIFVLSNDAELNPKHLYELEKGEHVAFTFFDRNIKHTRHLDLSFLLKPYSSKKTPLYAKSKKISFVLKKINKQKLKEITIKNNYKRVAIYQWIKSGILPIHLLDDIKNISNFDYKEITSQKGPIIQKKFPITKEFCWFLGIYLAEGCLVDRYFVDISNKDKEIRKRIVSFLKKYKFKFSKTTDSVIANSVLLNKMIKSLGLGNKSHNKTIPDFFYNFSKENIRSLLDGIYEGDGYKDKNSQEIEICSKGLRDGIANLEFLLGNVCSLRYRKKRGSYIARRLSKSTNSLSVDNIPSVFGSYIKRLREKKGLSQREIERKWKLNRSNLMNIENQRVNTISKKILKRINKIFKDKKLDKLINSNLFWLDVIKIIPTKSKEVVYDLEVRHQHLQNFIGKNGIVLHNSGYSHDPKAKKFLKENYEKHPEIFRHSWAPSKNHRKSKEQLRLDKF